MLYCAYVNLLYCDILYLYNLNLLCYSMFISFLVLVTALIVKMPIYHLGN